MNVGDGRRRWDWRCCIGSSSLASQRRRGERVAAHSKKIRKKPNFYYREIMKVTAAVV